MEGLFIAKIVEDLANQLPCRIGGWVFPSETTAAVLLEGYGNLVFNYRPPSPALYFSRERLRGEASSPFQRVLANKLKGELLAVEQLKLDRVICLHFSGEAGFVDVPAYRLVFELTGRNANFLILEATHTADATPILGQWGGRIVATAREITSGRNRYRVVRTGGLYVPPPPYSKHDPRTLTLTELAAWQQQSIAQLHRHIDGLGPTLLAEWAVRAQIGLDTPIEQRVPQVYAALRSVIENPSLSTGTLSEQARAFSRADQEAALRRVLHEPLHKRQTLLRNQLADVERSEQAMLQALEDREQADILMAYAYQVPVGASVVTLANFYQQDAAITLKLDPALSAIQNAEKRYQQVRRREEVYHKLQERLPSLEAERAEVERLLSQLEQANLEQLQAWQKRLEDHKEEKSPFGQRYRLRSGLEVLVGRNNKENDYLTHRLGRSQDYWFHVQGYPGSHVLVRCGQSELSPPDILSVAAIAAYHSKARNSGNVPVDYTRIKYVWRPKGAAAGKVHYTQQKTVYVDPALPERLPNSF